MDETKIEGDMPAEMRREQMLAFVKSQHFVRVSDLSTRFGVSGVTVRSDLDFLAERGQLRRIRGGAMPQLLPQAERSFEEMQSARMNEKALIGEMAASMVARGETVILDVGTTTTAVARALVRRNDLYDIVVFTNSLNIALDLEAASPRFTIVVTGGTLRPMQHSLVDPLAGLMLERINATIVFLGCNGIDPVAGITNINLPEADIKRRMLQSARQRVIVADGSKVGRTELAYLCGVDEVDLLITDSSADPAALKALREKNLQVIVADSPVSHSPSVGEGM